MVKKRKKCEHYFIHLNDMCKICGKTRDEVFEEKYQEQLKNKKLKMKEKRQKAISIASDALDGKSISEWEGDHGHGFWGNLSSGYVYDRYNR